jgi:tetratricopeptide (TPR) repeat protein
MYEAWEERGRSKRIALARKALAVSPLCADAYVLLAEEDARSVEEQLAHYQKGVEAGELALGQEGFKEYAGHFWGFLETRPYMRARAGLASALWQLGRHRDSIGHFQDMLKLNPNDNQGIRYVLAGHLLTLGDVAALKKLIKDYADDGSAAWLYTQALLAFQDKDPDADQIAKDAWQANDHVPGVLSGKQPVVASPDGYITMGGEDEAAYYVEEYGDAWKAVPGAVDWLVSITEKLPRRKRGTPRPT